MNIPVVSHVKDATTPQQAARRQAGKANPKYGTRIKVLSTGMAYHVKQTIARLCCVSKWMGPKVDRIDYIEPLIIYRSRPTKIPNTRIARS
jgi:hypothetical protein